MRIGRALRRLLGRPCTHTRIDKRGVTHRPVDLLSDGIKLYTRCALCGGNLRRLDSIREER